MLNQLDLLYLIQPLSVIIITSLLLIVYIQKKTLTISVFSASIVAYFIAIAGKSAISSALVLTNHYPTDPYALGLLYGLETSLLEVGLAYLVVWKLQERNTIKALEAPAYGACLAFWENGILLGLLAIPGLIVVINNGGSGLPSGSASDVLGLVALGTLERISSIIFHFSWGILTVIAATSKKLKYLVVALPMGFIDFLVAFASSMSIVAFELIVFIFAVLCLLIAYTMTKDDWPAIWGVSESYSEVPGPEPLSTDPYGSNKRFHTKGLVNNAQCPNCKAVFEAEMNLFLPHLGPLVLRKCPACEKWSFMRSNVDSPITWEKDDKKLQ